MDGAAKTAPAAVNVERMVAAIAAEARPMRRLPGVRFMLDSPRLRKLPVQLFWLWRCAGIGRANESARQLDVDDRRGQSPRSVRWWACVDGGGPIAGSFSISGRFGGDCTSERDATSARRRSRLPRSSAPWV